MEIPGILAFLVTIVLVFWIMFLARGSVDKKRSKELAGIVEPLGFDVLLKFNDEFIADFFHHRPGLGFASSIVAVCVADRDSMRIVVIERVDSRDEERCKDKYSQYYLVIDPSISAPKLVIKKRTPSTKSIWTASWGDVLFQVNFEEDPEFAGKFIVRGDPAQAQVFLNPTRRKSLCEASELPDFFSIDECSVFFSFPDKIDASTFERNLSQCLAVTRLMLD